MRIHIGRPRAALGVGFLTLAALAVLWSRPDSLSRATATPPPTPPAAAATATPPAPPSDYSKRVVAYIYKTIPITREELGEYLIARQGAERLNNLINLRIIQHVCQERGIEVSAAEVDAELADYVHNLGPGVTVKTFVEKMLRPRNKTLYEWREDVVKPELMMKKLCRDRVQVNEADLHEAYEALYGEKVDCRIILWPSSEQKTALTMYSKIRDSEEEFERASRQQASPSLASTGGRISPIARHTTGNDILEKAAFSLRPGELSQLIDTPEGYVVLKCVKRVAAQTGKRFEDVRGELQKSVFEKKLRLEIPKVFQELRVQADPDLILKDPFAEEDLRQSTERLMKDDATKPGSGTPPHGN